MKNLSYSIFFILLNIFLIGQDYLWPTNASKTITAFFAEERPRRYHSGIDIRTYGKVGFELYAIEEGYIEKIKIDYKGYGKTLYLRLNDENLAVYAHMDRFSTEIDNIISIMKKDYNRQVFEHEFEKEEIMVKKGEIIGYTGDTGTISGPHLHFEIRDKNNINLNPLVNFYEIEDEIPPIPYKIAVIPKTKETMIDGFSDIMIYDINQINNTEYYISDTISVIGEFGIALNIIDKINKQPFSYGLYNLELYIDGNLKYKVEYKKHDFSEGLLVLKERNYHLQKIYNERFYNLYNSTPNLSFIDQRSWPSYELNEGIHNIVIKAKDVNDNNIIIFGTVISSPNKEILYTTKETNDSIIFTVDSNDKNFNYTLNFCNKYNGEKINSIITNKKNISINKSMIKEPFTIINLYAKSSNGLNTSKYYYKSKYKSINSIKGKFNIKTFKHGALIQFQENTFSNKTAKINVILGDTTFAYKTKRIFQNTLTTDIIKYENLTNIKKIEIEYDSLTKINIKQNMYSSVYYPHDAFYLKKNDLIISSTTNFINDTMLIWIENNNTEVPEEYTLLLGPYEINPKTLVFDNYLDIKFEYPKEERIGIYYYNIDNENWTYLNTNYNNNEYTTNILSNEIICLLKEQESPIIQNLIPDINATYKSKDIDKLQFKVEDKLSGISSIDNISIKIDDLPILFEYNPYRKEVFYDFDKKLTVGKHLLEIEIKDNVGNLESIKGNFIIK